MDRRPSIHTLVGDDGASLSMIAPDASARASFRAAANGTSGAGRTPAAECGTALQKAGPERAHDRAARLIEDGLARPRRGDSPAYCISCGWRWPSTAWRKERTPFRRTTRCCRGTRRIPNACRSAHSRPRSHRRAMRGKTTRRKTKGRALRARPRDTGARKNSVSRTGRPRAPAWCRPFRSPTSDSCAPPPGRGRRAKPPRAAARTRRCSGRPSA